MGSPRVQRDPVTASGGAKKSPARKLPAGKAPRSSNGQPFGDVDPIGAPASKRVLRSQGKRTMRKLLDAAMIAFDKRGYHATRVNDVVEIAKTSHGTFYLYFSNKEDLLRALVTEASTEAQHLYDGLYAPTQRGDHAQWEDVHGWVRDYSALWIRYAPLFRVWTDVSTIDPELVDVIRQTFKVMSEALAQQIGPDRSGHIIDAEAAGMATLAMLDRFHYLREFLGQPVDDIALETITTMVYRALFDGND
jgi:AcrR family transcriptional regulator